MRSAPSKRETQYFEMLGNRAIYHQGWVRCDYAACPALGHGAGQDAGGHHRLHVGTLQHCRGLLGKQRLGAKNPSKLKELQALFPYGGGEIQRVPNGQLAPVAFTDGKTEARSPGKPNSPIRGENIGIPVGNAPVHFG